MMYIRILLMIGVISVAWYFVQQGRATRRFKAARRLAGHTDGGSMVLRRDEKGHSLHVS